MSTAGTSAPAMLTRLISGRVTDGRLAGPDEYRRYANTLNMRANIRGRTQHALATNVYEVGAHSVLLRGATFASREWRQLFCGGDDIIASVEYHTPDAVKAALGERKFRYAVTPTWDTFNLDGLVCSLGAMLALHSLHPNISTSTMCGEAFSVRSVAGMDDVFSALESGAVYIDPATSTRVGRPIFWALVAGANIAGSSVVTVNLSVNPNGAPVCQDLSGGQLAVGVSGALSLLASYYSLAGHGDAFAVALTKGLHSVLTVVGHSDEGGVLRDILRCGRYCAPHGGIALNLPLSGTLPMDNGQDAATVVTLVDTLVLTTAALVAHCDPMVWHDGNLFPTVYCLPSEHHADGTGLNKDDTRRIIAGEIAADFDRFARTYSRGLSQLLGLSCSSCGEVGSFMLVQMATSFGRKGSRHTEFASVAPYFWIEPTGLIPRGFLGTSAEEGGSGALATWGETREEKLFPGAVLVGAPSTSISEWYLPYHSARTLPFITYALNHKRDGLVNVLLRGFTCDNMLMGRLDPAELRQMRANEDCVSLGSILWTRGQAKIPHPGEALYMDGRVSCTVVHESLDTNVRAVPLSHIPTCDELADATIIYTCTRLTALPNAKICREPSSVKRARSLGTQALVESAREVDRTLRCRGYRAWTCDAPPPREAMVRQPPPPPGPALSDNPVSRVPAVRTGMPTREGETHFVAGQRIGVQYEHAPNQAPRPAQPGDGGTCVAAPRTGARDGGVGPPAAPFQPPPAPPAAPNTQQAAPTAAGAAPTP